MKEDLFSRQDLIDSPSLYFQSIWMVRFQEIDVAGIVFFARIFEACHDAYIQFLLKSSEHLKEVFEKRTYVAPLVHAEADFIKPIRFADEIFVEIVRIRATERKIHWGFRLKKKADEQVVAVAQTVHVFVSGATFERMLVPDEILSFLSALLP